MRRRAIGGGLIALLALGAPRAATADEPEGPMRPDAQALYDRALTAFGTHDYAAAIRDLEAGYALDPRRDLLFAAAQAERLSGDCRAAVVLYQRFLETKPPAVQVDATHVALARCAQELARRPEVVVTTTTPAPPPRPAPPSWRRDPWGLALTATGVAALGVGTGYLIAAQVARGDAGDAATYADYTRRWSTATDRQDVAIGALAIGGVLVAAGVARFLIVRRRGRSPVTALWIGPGLVGGRF